MTLDELLATLTPEQREGVEREFQKLRAEYDAQGSGGGAVAWTTDKPTEPGVYLMRGWWIRHENTTCAVEVFKSPLGMFANTRGQEGWIDCRYDDIAKLSNDFEWLGPLSSHRPSLASDFTMEDAEKFRRNHFIAMCKGREDNACITSAEATVIALNATFPKGRPAAEVGDGELVGGWLPPDLVKSKRYHACPACGRAEQNYLRPAPPQQTPRGAGGEEVEAIVACLGDDAQLIRGHWPEIAGNMEKAARLIERLHPADPAGEGGEK